MSRVNVKALLNAKYPIMHINTAIVKSKIIINFFRSNLSARTPPKGPVTTPTSATMNKIVESALAFPVVSYIQTPIPKKDMDDPVQEIVCPNQSKYIFLSIVTQY